MRRIFAKNLHKIEAGLKAHPNFKQLEEVTFELGRLDLLCIDSKQRTTIIELQLGSLDDGHIGKACRYFGWFAAKYDVVRAILLFENATPGVLEAYKKAVPWLELRKYAFSAEMKLEPSQLVQV
jgi:RecB family endonuclease NucS